VLGNSLIEKVIRKGKCTAVVTSTSVTSPYRGDQVLHRVWSVWMRVRVRIQQPAAGE